MDAALTQHQQAYLHWYDQFHSRVHIWTGDCSVKAADVVLMLPDLLQLALDLQAESRITPEEREKLTRTADSVLRGIKFLPDHEGSLVALISDSVKIARALEDLSPDILRDHWRQTDDITALVHRLIHHPETYAPRC